MPANTAFSLLHITGDALLRSFEIQTGQLVALGYGTYVRSDEVVAVDPITESR